MGVVRMVGAGVCGRVAFVESIPGEGGGTTYVFVSHGCGLFGGITTFARWTWVSKGERAWIVAMVEGGLDNDPSAWP